MPECWSTPDFDLIYEPDGFVSVVVDWKDKTIRIPDSSYWPSHPEFLSQFEPGEMVTMKDLDEFMSQVGSDTYRLLMSSMNEVYQTFSEDCPLFRLSVHDSVELLLLDEQTFHGVGKPRYFFEGFGLPHENCETVQLYAGSAANNPVIHNWSFVPYLRFLSCPKEQTTLYFGMEVEVSTHLRAEELNKIITRVEPVQDEFLYFKSDSSITGRYSYNYEIVTMPMTPRRMRKEWRTLFKKLETLASGKGMQLEDVFDMSLFNNNGIHVHVSKHAFSSKSLKNRFLTGWNVWDTRSIEWLDKVTLRREASVKFGREYYKPNDYFVGRTLPWRIMIGQGGCTNDRHTDARRAAAHETENTCEVRVFYGLFDLKHILTCIEMVEAMFWFTRNAAYSDYNNRVFVERFSEFVRKQQGYRYLKERLKQCA